MALGFTMGNGEGGSFLPLVKYDARSGRMSLSDRVQGVNGWESVDTDITRDQPTFAIDFGSIEVGWIAFGKPPVFAVAPLGQPMPKRPEGPDFKQGFRVKVAGKALKGVREWSTTANAVKGALEEVHTAFEAAPEAAEGKLPLVQFADTTPIKTQTPQGTTTNYAPVLKIVGWVERNGDMLGPRTVPPPAARQAAPAHPAGGAPLPPKSGADLNDDIPFAAEFR